MMAHANPAALDANAPTAYNRPMTRRAQLIRALSYLFLSVSSFIMIFPVLYIALAAFTTPERFFATFLFPVPNTLNLPLIGRLLTRGVWDAYLFTLARCAFYVTLALITGIMGGYIFSKLRFPGRSKLFLLVLSGMVMPAIVMILPMFIMVARVPFAGGNDQWGGGGYGLINQWPVLFIFGWVPPFAILLLKQSFDMLPTEYEDAAKLDGAGLFTIILRVYGPLLKPPIIALILVTFLAVWNDYLWPSLTIPPAADFAPITMRIGGISTRSASGIGGGSPGAMMRALMALWPPAALFLLLQRYFVQGLVASGLKG
jgi:multiple sugar transport system permease protein